MGPSKRSPGDAPASERPKRPSSYDQSGKRPGTAPRRPRPEYQAMVEAIAGLIYVANPDYEVEFVNRGVIEHLGFDPTGRRCYAALYGLEQICPWCEAERVLRGETVHQEILSPQDSRWYHLTSTLLKQADGSTAKLTLIQDITERKVAEELSRQLAYQDPLTGLPNRALFQDRLEHALSQASRYGYLAAVMILDLDYFKICNDTLGHPVGDAVLQAAGRRLRGLLRKDDTVARLGGDEFAIVSAGISQAEDAARIARKLLDLFRRPFRCEGKEIWITTSIGIALFPLDAKDSATLVKNADKALYRAKAVGRNNYQFYAEEAYWSILIPLE